MTGPQIQTIVSEPFSENTYVVWLEGRRDAIVVDPGLEPELILEFLAQHELRPAAIFNTHGHADHIGGNAALKQAFPEAPIVIGENEKHLLTDPEANLSAPFGMPIVSPPADQTVREGETIAFAGMEFEVLEIPGHSPGHVVYVHRTTPILILGGDVLFRGSVGRTDFPGGSFDTLARGIRTKLFPLPGDSDVYPGHGPVTTTGHEKRTNPFVGEGDGQ